MGGVGASKTYALCPLIMTPPPMTLHVTGYIFRPWSSSVLAIGEDADCSDELEPSIGDSSGESRARMAEGSWILQKVIHCLR